jgi:MoaA/NifB/PqqE/SkfB family radical SAM enzyme
MPSISDFRAMSRIKRQLRTIIYAIGYWKVVQMSLEMTADEVKAVKKLAKQIAHRARQNELYANDPNFRERKKEASRIYAVKRREREKEARRQVRELAVPPEPKPPRPPGKPGRPRLILDPA